MFARFPSTIFLHHHHTSLSNENSDCKEKHVSKDQETLAVTFHTQGIKWLPLSWINQKMSYMLKWDSKTKKFDLWMSKEVTSPRGKTFWAKQIYFQITKMILKMMEKKTYIVIIGRWKFCLYKCIYIMPCMYIIYTYIT